MDATKRKPLCQCTVAELNDELSKFARARLREVDNSGRDCRMEVHGELRPHGRFSRWTCSECGAMSFRPTPLGAPPFCQSCGAKCASAGSPADSAPQAASD